MDAERALAEFDRWLAANDPNGNVDPQRAFFDWLPRSYADPGDGAAIMAAWDAREAERGAREEADRAAGEEAARRLLGSNIEHADPPLDGDERVAFLAWWATCRAADDKYDVDAPDGNGLYAHEVVDHWRGGRRREAEARERRARDEADQVAAKRAALFVRKV